MSTESNGTENQRGLKLDNVLSTQPELGPNVPDGGYGWVVFLASSFFHILIPSLTVGFGVIMIVSRLETNAPEYPTLWDNKFIFMPIFYMAFMTLTDPWVRKFITQSTWPRLVSTAGTCLICAGLLVAWRGINSNYNVATFIVAGIISGIGTTIVMVQIEVIISQYFRLKLRAIRIIFAIIAGIGFIATPIAVGHHAIKSGIHHVLIWYQAIILQGVVVCMIFKKPLYLKSRRKSYDIIQNLSDDEDDVLGIKKTALRNKRVQNSSTNGDIVTENSSTSQIFNISQTSNETQKVPKKENWETFDDDSSRQSKVKVVLHNTFSDTNENAHHLAHNSGNDLKIPQPIFDDNVATNDTYSYETITQDEEVNNVQSTNSNMRSRKIWRISMGDLKEPTFYKSLLQIITTKFSTFTFWTLFPSYMYAKAEHIQIRETYLLVGCVIGISVLLFTIISMFINSNSTKYKALFWWIFSWAGTVGYYTISSTQTKYGLLFGACNVTLSLSVLNVLDAPLLKVNALGHSSQRHFLLCTMSGLAFCTFFLLDLSYKSCFHFIALLQFLTGSVWLSNFFYKNIKKLTM